jgi:hypothetical protein
MDIVDRRDLSIRRMLRCIVAALFHVRVDGRITIMRIRTAADLAAKWRAEAAAYRAEAQANEAAPGDTVTNRLGTHIDSAINQVRAEQLDMCAAELEAELGHEGTAIDV